MLSALWGILKTISDLVGRAFPKSHKVRFVVAIALLAAGFIATGWWVRQDAAAVRSLHHDMDSRITLTERGKIWIAERNALENKWETVAIFEIENPESVCAVRLNGSSVVVCPVGSISTVAKRAGHKADVVYLHDSIGQDSAVIEAVGAVSVVRDGDLVRFRAADQPGGDYSFVLDGRFVAGLHVQASAKVECSADCGESKCTQSCKSNQRCCSYCDASGTAVCGCADVVQSIQVLPIAE